MTSLQIRLQCLNAVLLATVFCTASSCAAQRPSFSEADLVKRIESSPALPFREEQVSLNAPVHRSELGAVSGVAIGATGLLYVIQRGAGTDPIAVFKEDGSFVRSWGRGDFTLPHSLRIDPQGNVWAVDAGASRVIKYSSLGKKLLTITIRPLPETGSAFRGVTDVAFAPNGHVFLTDGYGNARVLEYTADGTKLRQWGSLGFGPGEFHLPHAIQISRRGILYVADRENGRIEKFDLNGSFLGEFNHLGRCYALKLSQGALWATMGPTDQDPGAPGWLVKLDPHSGRMLGHMNVPEQRAGHALDLTRSGEPIVTAGGALILFRRRSHKDPSICAPPSSSF